MSFLNISFVIVLLIDGSFCGCPVPRCNWFPWEAWSGCSRTCGGGSQSRSRLFCCKLSLVNDIEACMRDCGKQYIYSEFHDSKQCQQWCYNDGSIRSSGYGCLCPDIYHGYCCENLCPEITQCKHRKCTYAYDTVCKECNEDNVIFKRWSSDRECQRMCAMNYHFCWPGTCSTTGLTKDCQCANGFVKRSTVDNGWINAGETTCQPNTLPDILTCDTVAVGPNGEKKRAMSTSNSTACQYLGDMYGNYKPSIMEFKMSSEFSVTISLLKPSFIAEETFGISDTTITVKVQAVTGSYEAKSIHKQLVDTSSSTSIRQAQHDSGNIIVNQAKYNLQNGEALCLEFEAKAGGYMKSIDTRTDTHTRSGPVPYTKVQNKGQCVTDTITHCRNIAPSWGHVRPNR